jgi:type II secretory pathway component GspD/PulD (secretin)
MGVTVSFEDDEVRDVFNNFSDVVGVSFVFGPGVEGPVNAFIRNQRWDEALSAILDSHGLHAVETAPGLWRIETLRSFLHYEEQRLLVSIPGSKELLIESDLGMPPITLVYEGQDVYTVFENFADFSGVSFVLGPGVEGTVHGRVRDQPWNAALSAILEAHGLHAVEAAPQLWRIETLESFLESEELRSHAAVERGGGG